MWRILAVSTAAAFLTLPASAIIVRHDVSGDAYVASEEDYPFLATLYTTPNGTRDCVATLIAPQWLITARHCTRELDEPIAQGRFKVSFADGRKAQVTKIARAIDLEGNPFSRDMALLRLAEPAQGITPLKLYDGSHEAGLVVHFPGWGDIGTGVTGVEGPSDGSLRVAQNRVERTDEAFVVFHFDDPRGEQSGALRLEGISGPGDSGGPALIKTADGWQVIGISSHQRNIDTSEGVYGVDEYYVRISTSLDWIGSVLDSD